MRLSLNYSQSRLAELLDIHQTAISEIEKGKVNPSFNIIKALSLNVDNLNIDWLLTGRGEMFITMPLPKNSYLNEENSYLNSVKLPNNETNEAAEPMEKYNVVGTPNLVHLNEELVHLNTVKLPNKASNNILVPVAAFGGYLGEWTQEYIDQDLVYVDIPGSPRDARTFEILGTSMEPVIMSGDFVVTKRIEKFEQIKKGHMYVIISLLQGITVKYVYDSGDSLILEPANRLEHIPIVLSKSDIREIWQVVLRLTKHIIDTEKALYQVHKTKHNTNPNTV